MNIKIYAHAAKLIDSGKETYSCNSIWGLQGNCPSKEENYYYELFVTDRNDRDRRFTFDCLYQKIYKVKPTDEELKQIRILALLFAAEYFNDENNN